MRIASYRALLRPKGIKGDVGMSKSPNAIKLRAIVEVFGISIAGVARAVGVSRALVSRILSPNDPLQGNEMFWARVENSLAQLIASRSRQVFDIKAIPADELDECLRKKL